MVYVYRSQEMAKFYPRRFIEFWISNFLYSIMGILSLPFLYVWHGFNWKILVNQQFIGFIPPFIWFHTLAASLGGGMAYFTYLKLYRQDEIEERGYKLPDWIDMSHQFVIAVNRACVIAGKYGYYSDEHEWLKKNVVFDITYLINDFILTTLANISVETLQTRIQTSLKLFGIQESNFVIEVAKN